MSDLDPIELVSSVDATSDVTSVQLNLGHLTTYSIQVNFSGGAGNLAGTLTLESSIDNSTYVTVSGSSQAVTSSGDHLWSVTDAGYRYVRAKWVYTSGTGNIDVKAILKRNFQANG